MKLIKYSAEGFLPTEIWDHVTVEEYLEFRLYCLETMSLVLERISESKENDVLSNSSEEGIFIILLLSKV